MWQHVPHTLPAIMVGSAALLFLVSDQQQAWSAFCTWKMYMSVDWTGRLEARLGPSHSAHAAGSREASGAGSQAGSWLPLHRQHRCSHW